MGLFTLARNFTKWQHTIIALEHVAAFKNKMKIFWACIFILSIVGFVWQAVTLTESFLSYKKSTVVRLFVEPDAPFPAVTVCNLNPFKKSAVASSPKLSDLMSAYNYVTQSRKLLAPELRVKRKKRSEEDEHYAHNHVVDEWDFDLDHQDEVFFHARQKRAVTGTNCTADTKSSTINVPPYGYQDYEIVACENLADMCFAECGTSSINFCSSEFTQIATGCPNIELQLDTVFYKCLHPRRCANGACAGYTNMAACSTDMNTCAASVLPSSDYPPTTSCQNPVNLLCAQLAATCSFSDASCTNGDFSSTVTPAKSYTYFQCNTTNTANICLETCTLDGSNQTCFTSVPVNLGNCPNYFSDFDKLYRNCYESQLCLADCNTFKYGGGNASCVSALTTYGQPLCKLHNNQYNDDDNDDYLNNHNNHNSNNYNYPYYYYYNHGRTDNNLNDNNHGRAHHYFNDNNHGRAHHYFNNYNHGRTHNNLNDNNHGGAHHYFNNYNHRRTYNNYRRAHYNHSNIKLH
uniref:Uncharacterized protein n=1 Tax=Plectus sambesii TaxID=2011161 RepID=A0A914X5H7_9BILA